MTIRWVELVVFALLSFIGPVSSKIRIWIAIWFIMIVLRISFTPNHAPG